jgi:hypothetical protein
VRFIGGTTAILLNKIRLVAVVGGNEVTNPFVVTEVYVQEGRQLDAGLPLIHPTAHSLNGPRARSQQVRQFPNLGRSTRRHLPRARHKRGEYDDHEDSDQEKRESKVKKEPESANDLHVGRILCDSGSKACMRRSDRPGMVVANPAL